MHFSALKDASTFASIARSLKPGQAKHSLTPVTTGKVQKQETVSNSTRRDSSTGMDDLKFSNYKNFDQVANVVNWSINGQEVLTPPRWQHRSCLCRWSEGATGNPHPVLQQHQRTRQQLERAKTSKTPSTSSPHASSSFHATPIRTTRQSRTSTALMTTEEQRG